MAKLSAKPKGRAGQRVRAALAIAALLVALGGASAGCLLSFDDYPLSTTGPDAGDAPSLPGYAAEVEKLCRPSALEHALRRHPRTTFIVPHLFAAHFEQAARFLGEFEHLYLDTAMAIAGYIPLHPETRQTEVEAATAWQRQALELVRAHPDRILYGSDFPNLPYEWDRELRTIAEAALPAPTLGAFLGGNARRLFRID